jgi:hypothetical protein
MFLIEDPAGSIGLSPSFWVGLAAGFLLGIPSGYIANCLYGKRQRKKRGSQIRWTWTYSGGQVKFEGPSTTAEMSGLIEIIKTVGPQVEPTQLPPGQARSGD